MTAIGNVTLNSVVYTPTSRNSATGFVWTDRTAAQSSGWGELTYTGSTPKGQYLKRVGFKLTFPQVVTDDSACGCVGDLADLSSMTIYVDVDVRQSVTQLTDLCARIVSLVQTTVFQNAVKYQEGVY